MQRLEVSGAVRPIYGSLGVKQLIGVNISLILIYETFAVTNMLYPSDMQPVCHDAGYGTIVCA